MKRRETLGIDLTAIIDIVFILLIFFIVSSVFKKEELALVLDLPSSNAKSIEVKEDEIFIELNKDSLAIKGIKVSFDSLEDNLKEIKDIKQTIVLRIDEKVEYKNVIKVLDLLQKYDLNNLALITKKEK
ncbi:MAG: biopolymer transporter ExbD [Campylobacteraceae bacterium]|nr:biopolymer transporter ExbD [Campylobacteraceae bacterium]